MDGIKPTFASSEGIKGHRKFVYGESLPNFISNIALKGALRDIDTKEFNILNLNLKKATITAKSTYFKADVDTFKNNKDEFFVKPEDYSKIQNH